MLAAVVLGAGLLGACGRGSASTSSTVEAVCSAETCRASADRAPTSVRETDYDTRRTKQLGSSKSRTTTTKTLEVEFRVVAFAPGSVRVDSDGVTADVPAGGTFRADGVDVRVEAADGRSATFTWAD